MRSLLAGLSDGHIRDRPQLFIGRGASEPCNATAQQRCSCPLALPKAPCERPPCVLRPWRADSLSKLPPASGSAPLMTELHIRWALELSRSTDTLLGRANALQAVMVLLTMTPSIVDALKQVEEQHKADDQRKADEPSNDASQDQSNDAASSSTEPAVGSPVSHSDIISLYKKLSALETSEPKYSLEQLLQGSQVYIPPPPPPKPEPVSFTSVLYQAKTNQQCADNCFPSLVRRVQSSHGPSSPR